MFNFNAETFVILYPYAAGGRFLQMAMSLDPAITVVHTDMSEHAPYDQLFDGYRHYLKTSSQHNAHYKNTGHLEEYNPEFIQHADRYAFCLHQVELEPALMFLRRCRDLKIFIINTSTDNSLRQLKTRRWFFAQRVLAELQDSYKLHTLELQKIKSVNETLKFRVGAWPVGSIELEDYWNPKIAIPLLNKFFAEHNINCNRWEELYHVWHANAIEATLNEVPSNS